MPEVKRKAVTFSLKGEVFNPVAIKPVAESAKKYLDKLEFGTLLYTGEVCAALKCYKDKLGEAARNELKAYCVIRSQGNGNNQILWGSKKTIAELIRQAEV